MSVAHAAERRRYLATQLLRLDRHRAPVLAQHPRGELRERRVVGDEDAVFETPRRPVGALDPPGRVAADLDAGLAEDVADLPGRTPAELLDVEVGRHAEVALAARRELDVAADPRDTERADVVAVEILPDDVPRAAIVEERVWVERALAFLAA